MGAQSPSANGKGFELNQKSSSRLYDAYEKLPTSSNDTVHSKLTQLLVHESPMSSCSEGTSAILTFH